MEAMILPFEDAELKILKACDFDGDTSMFEAILKDVYGGEVPDVFGRRTFATISSVLSMYGSFVASDKGTMEQRKKKKIECKRRPT